jgi:hypothetical protein
MVSAARRAVAAGVIATLVSSGCIADQPLLGASDEPALTLVLTRGPTPQAGAAPDSTLHALVVTIGSPFTGYYRTTQRFDMTRRSDGRRFDWVTSDTTGPVDLARGYAIPRAAWNAHLAWEGTGGLLGRSDLADGETYDLVIESEGRLITGSVTVPAAPVASVVSNGPERLVTWPVVPGAVSYVVDAANTFFGRITTEGALLLVLQDTALGPQPSWLRIRSQERNIADYTFDRELRSSGIVGAYGVFGAIGLDSVAIPPWTPAAEAALAAEHVARIQAARRP